MTPIFGVKYLINWKDSKVIALDEGMLYVNPLYEDEKESILEELTKKLTSLKSKTGKLVEFKCRNLNSDQSILDQ